MKTHTIEWSQNLGSNPASLENAAGNINRILRVSSRLFLALVPALGMLVAATWAITVPGVEQFLQAAIWASGFVFLGLAVESDKPRVGWLLSTGITLPALALLSSHIAPEFAVVAAALVATWVAATVIGQTRDV